MAIQKIIAKNSTEGLKRIGDTFGRDALILKTIRRNGHVEYLIEADVDSSVAETASTSVTNREVPMHAASDEGPPEREASQDRQIKQEYRAARMKMLSAIADKADLPREAPVADEAPISRRKIRSELTVSSLLDALHLTPGIAARLRGYKRIDEVTSNLAMMINTESPIDTGIVAFVGPAGAGKTTSLIKLVVQHVKRYGKDSCAIINCDRFRMGAMEQLTRFGELIGVDVLQAGPSSSLNQAIANVHKRRLVVIDTPGLGCQSDDLKQQLFQLSASHYNIDRVLVVPADLQYASMQKARAMYVGRRSATCIASRMDEAASYGGVVSFLAQTEMPLRYLATGPQIPEDLVAADAVSLVQSAVNLIDFGFAKDGMSDFTKRQIRKNSHQASDRKTEMGDVILNKKVMDI